MFCPLLGFVFALQTTPCPPEQKVTLSHDEIVRQWEATWQAKDLTILRKQGLLVGYPYNIGHLRRPKPDPYECAVAFSATCKHINSVLDDLEAQVADHGPNDPELIEELQRISEWPVSIRLLGDLGREYTPELQNMGVTKPVKENTDELNAKIAALILSIPQFADVPASHWAAQDVLDLRRWGILEGFPSNKPGNFHSSRAPRIDLSQ